MSSASLVEDVYESFEYPSAPLLKITHRSAWRTANRIEGPQFRPRGPTPGGQAPSHPSIVTSLEDNLDKANSQDSICGETRRGGGGVSIVFFDYFWLFLGGQWKLRGGGVERHQRREWGYTPTPDKSSTANSKSIPIFRSSFESLFYHVIKFHLITIDI